MALQVKELVDDGIQVGIVFDVFLPHASEGKIHHRIVVIDKGNDHDDEKPKADPFYL